MTRSAGLSLLVCLALLGSSLLSCSDADSTSGERTGSVTPEVTAFVDVTVLALESERVVPDQTVVVRRDVIERVGPASSVAVPREARVVDGRGAYLAPGLTDAHAHLEYEPAEWMALFLANGITTVFDLRGSTQKAAVLRGGVQSGEVAGPNIYMAGPFINLPEIRTSEDAAHVVDEHVRIGYDFIKVHGPLRRPTYDQLIASAREQGVPVIGHAPRNLPFDAVIENRQAMIAHAEELIYTHFESLDSAGIPPLAERMAAAGVWLTPTLAMFEKIAQQWGNLAATEAVIASPEGAYLGPELLEYWRGGNPYVVRDSATAARTWGMFRFQLHLVRQLHEAGVPMLTGTDAPLPAIIPGFSLHAELETLERAGLETSDVLAAATLNAGEFIAQHTAPEDRFGSVAEGYRADIVLLETNPLTDISAYRRPLGVMANGRWFPRAELERMLEATRERMANRKASTPAVMPVDLTPDELEAFEGRFVADAGSFAIVTELREGMLWLRIPEYPEFPLEAIGALTFRGIGAPARVEFDEARESIFAYLFNDDEPLFRGRRAHIE